MDKSSVTSSMIGGNEVNTTSADIDKDSVYEKNNTFWNTIGSDVLGTTSLPFYGAFVSEEKCRLFDDVAGMKVLEIGCGNGKSLEYIGKRKASELWGMDISENQLAKTRQYLETCGLTAKLICSPMEEECGIPTDYFDVVYSVYAIGWTTDLDVTFNRIASYLKKGGIFIFSWSHPIHKCVAIDNDLLIFKRRYFDESRYTQKLGESELTLSDYQLSTYVNALANAGFTIERMVEESDDDIIGDKDDDFAQKAKMLPVTFVMKARKM